jgi:hypothetical protein
MSAAIASVYFVSVCVSESSLHFMTKEAFNKFHILFPYEKYNNGIMGESA